MLESDDRSAFDVEVVEVGGRTVVAARGEIDLSAADALRDCIDRCCDSRRPLILDLADVTFMDSTGIKALVWAHHRQGRLQEALVVQNPSVAVRQVLALAGLSEMFVVAQAEPATDGPGRPDGDRG